MKLNIRILYLYLFSFVGLLIVVIGGIRIVDLGIKTFIFKDADRYEIYTPAVVDQKGQGIEQQPSVEDQKTRQDMELKRQKQRELSGSLSMILVGIPLYLYHWKTIQKEAKNKTD